MFFIRRLRQAGRGVRPRGAQPGDLALQARPLAGAQGECLFRLPLPGTGALGNTGGDAGDVLGTVGLPPARLRDACGLCPCGLLLVGLPTQRADAVGQEAHPVLGGFEAHPGVDRPLAQCRALVRQPVALLRIRLLAAVLGAVGLRQRTPSTLEFRCGPVPALAGLRDRVRRRRGPGPQPFELTGRAGQFLAGGHDGRVGVMEGGERLGLFLPGRYQACVDVRDLLVQLCEPRLQSGQFRERLVQGRAGGDLPGLRGARPGGAAVGQDGPVEGDDGVVRVLLQVGECGLP